MKPEVSFENCVLPCSYSILGLEEAITKTENRFEKEKKKKSRHAENKRFDSTPNHPIYTAHDYPFEFEKSELLAPVDKDNYLPVSVLSMINTIGYFKRTVVVGNKTKEFLVDIVNKFSENFKFTPFEYIEDVPEYSKTLLEKKRLNNPELQNGDLVCNLEQGFKKLGEPNYFLEICGDILNITNEDIENIIKIITKKKKKGVLAHVFVNSILNSDALGFPRNFGRLPLKGDGCYTSYNKEGNAYFYSGEMYKDKRNFRAMQASYTSRKFFTKKAQQNLVSGITKLILDIPRILYHVSSGKISIEPHRIHNLIWDIDSYEDLILQFYRKWDHTKNPHYDLMVKVAEELTKPDIIKGTIYEDYNSRLKEHLELFNIPPVLKVEGKEYRTEVLYNSEAFMKKCVRK